MTRYSAPPVSPELAAQLVEAARDESVSHRRIGARFGVSHKTVAKYATLAGLSRAKPASERPSGRPCVDCGRLCRSVRSLCRTCAAFADGRTPIWQRTEPQEAAALTGGRWVPNGRGVMVWLPECDDQEMAS